MPAPKVFQLLHFPDTFSPISGRFSINLSLLFCKSIVFPSQRPLHLSVKSIRAGPKGVRLLSEAPGDRGFCAVGGVMVRRAPRTPATPSRWSRGSKEQLSEKNIEIKQTPLIKKIVKNTPGEGHLPRDRKLSWPRPQALLSKHERKGRVGGHGFLGEILQIQRKWFNHGYRDDSQNETSGVQRKQIIANSGSSVESQEPSTAIFWPLPLVQSPGFLH